MNLTRNMLMAVVLAAGGVSGAQNVLALVYSDGFTGDPSIDNIRQSLVATGASVTWKDGAVPGDLAGYLSSAAYDSVFIHDITLTGGLTDLGDAGALNAWYNAGKSAVLDGRSYGSLFQPLGGGSDLFLRNVATFFNANGGGLYVGGDDHPTWTKNANSLLNAAGFASFSGDFVEYRTYAAASPLYIGMTDPNNDLAWDYGPGDWTVSESPVGLQVNGTTLEGIFFNGNNIPLISSYLVPAPGAVGLAVVAGLLASRRRRT